MPTLLDAYENCRTVLKPQRQGTCALYAFWFATLLLNNLNTDKKPIVYPRKNEQRAAQNIDKGSEETSLRDFAKDLWSAQGELLTVTEVITTIVMCSWDWVAHVWGGDGRAGFITTSLTNNRPVMVAHLAGGTPSAPMRSIPLNRQCGPHWSLIIGETSDNYIFIDPNHPLKTEQILKSHILISNEIVDTFVMEKSWVKPKYRKDGAPIVISSKDLPGLQASRRDLDLTPVKTYVIKRPQALNNLLVAVC
jgi:hypothetical protein